MWHGTRRSKNKNKNKEERLSMSNLTIHVRQFQHCDVWGSWSVMFSAMYACGKFDVDTMQMDMTTASAY
jgi:hypothetical protein